MDSECNLPIIYLLRTGVRCTGIENRNRGGNGGKMEELRRKDHAYYRGVDSRWQAEHEV